MAEQYKVQTYSFDSYTVRWTKVFVLLLILNYKDKTFSQIPIPVTKELWKHTFDKYGLICVDQKMWWFWTQLWMPILIMADFYFQQWSHFSRSQMNTSYIWNNFLLRTILLSVGLLRFGASLGFILTLNCSFSMLLFWVTPFPASLIDFALQL